MTEYLHWNTEIKIADVIALLGFLATVGVVIYAALQVRQSVRATRAEILMRLLDTYFGDRELRSMYYRIDYNEFHFDVGKFPLSDDEPHVDRLIYFFDAVGRLVKMKALTMDEVSLIAYQAQRVLENPEVSAYLDWLDGEYARDSRPLPAHREARELAKAITAARRRISARGCSA